MKQQFYNCLSPAKTMMPCFQTQTIQNLQVIKLLQRYIWCEHIQYSNDLKRKMGKEKTSINTDVTQ